MPRYFAFVVFFCGAVCFALPCHGKERDLRCKDGGGVKCGSICYDDGDCFEIRILAGSRTIYSIQKVVFNNISVLYYAYNKRVDKPDSVSVIRVAFAVNGGGKVISAKMVESTMNNKEFENFVMEKVKGWDFYNADDPGGITEFIFPLIFRRQ